MADASAIRALHVDVTRISRSLARIPAEVTAEYVNGFISSSLSDGLIFVAERPETETESVIVGELHAYRNGLFRFTHMLTSLTIAVHPNSQGLGVGRLLFQALLHEVRVNHPHIVRIELIVQENNARARRLYESVGFREEGRLEQGIIDLHTGQLETDIPMAWLRARDTQDN